MFASLPLHPLVVHVPVLLLPVSAVCTVILAVKPSLINKWAAALTVLVAVGFGGAFLATQTGEELEDSLREGGEKISETLHDHAELGEQARTLAFGLLVIVAAMWFLGRKDYAWKRSWMMPVLRVLGVVVAIAVGYVTYRTGHTGATSVWND